MTIAFRDVNIALAAGYVLTLAGVLVAVSLAFHPLPAGGFDEQVSVLGQTSWWGAIHAAIAFGFVLCVLGALLALVSGGILTRHWITALSWGAIAVGMIYFTGVALINAWVMHPLAEQSTEQTALFDVMNDLLIGFGWLGNPLFLFGLTALAIFEFRTNGVLLSRGVAAFGMIASILSWGRGIGSATGLYFLEPLVLANIPAFMWFSYLGYRIARLAKKQMREVAEYELLGLENEVA